MNELLPGGYILCIVMIPSELISTGNEWLLLPDHWLVLAFRDLLMQDARTQAEARAPAKKEKSASASVSTSTGSTLK